MRRLAGGLAVGLALCAAPAVAQDDSVMRSMTGVEGRCTSLMFGADDLTGMCQDAVLQVHFVNGRFNVSFLIKEDRGLVGFSGQAAAQTVEAGRIVQPIERILLIAPGAEVTELTGQGRCSWSDFNAGVSKLLCEFEASDGRVKAEFETDGAPPRVTAF